MNSVRPTLQKQLAQDPTGSSEEPFRHTVLVEENVAEGPDPYPLQGFQADGGGELFGPMGHRCSGLRTGTPNRNGSACRSAAPSCIEGECSILTSS